jgi:hypothetical protein
MLPSDKLSWFDAFKPALVVLHLGAHNMAVPSVASCGIDHESADRISFLIADLRLGG